jgi:predicted Zn finger-like uncharacterized protein
MLTTCPSCQTKLKLADNLVGRQVRCPACQNVFRVQAPAAEVVEVEVLPEAVQPRPAPRPVVVPAPQPVPRRRPEPEPEGEFEGLAEAGADLERGRRLARRGAGALLFATIIDVVAWLLFIVFMITSGAGEAMGERARAGTAVIVALSFVYLIPLIFMGLAAGLLASLRGRGLVITGCVMAFIAALELLPYSIFWGLVIAGAISGPGVQVGRLILPMLILIACVLGLVSSISAGIRGLVTLGKPAVKAAYR